MELAAINNIRARYMSLLSGDNKYNDTLSKLIERPIEKPILSVTDLNAESDLNRANEQRQLSEILLDMYSINNGAVELKNTIQDIITNLDNSLDIILSSAQKQKAQAEDLNVICGKGSQYSTILPVFTDDFGNTSAEILNNKTLGAAITDTDIVPYDIVSLKGNGYSGNAFVYNDNAFENETDDRSDLTYIIDSNDTTVYEYSRICTKDKTETIGGLINYDDKEVECIITLKAETSICKAIIHSMDPGLIVRKIETSQDGYTFAVHSEADLYINKTNEVYYDPNYVYSGGIICFPYAPYVRLTIASNTVCDDMLAIENEDGTIRKINAYRKKISIQGIQLYTASYTEVSVQTGNILKDGTVDRISLFASEYIPDHFTDKEYITYYLIVNGQEYEVSPINTGRAGISIIRYSEEEISLADNTQLIHETIKTVGLKLIIRPYNGRETPYVSNLKLCIGKNTGNIYV